MVLEYFPGATLLTSHGHVQKEFGGLKGGGRSPQKQSDALSRGCVGVGNFTELDPRGHVLPSSEHTRGGLGHVCLTVVAQKDHRAVHLREILRMLLEVFGFC